MSESMTTEAELDYLRSEVDRLELWKLEATDAIEDLVAVVEEKEETSSLPRESVMVSSREQQMLFINEAFAIVAVLHNRIYPQDRARQHRRLGECFQELKKLDRMAASKAERILRPAYAAAMRFNIVETAKYRSIPEDRGEGYSVQGSRFTYPLRFISAFVRIKREKLSFPTSNPYSNE